MTLEEGYYVTNSMDVYIGCYVALETFDDKIYKGEVVGYMGDSISVDDEKEGYSVINDNDIKFITRRK